MSTSLDSPRRDSAMLRAAATGLLSPRDLGLTTLPGYMPQKVVSSPRRQNFQCQTLASSSRGRSQVGSEKYPPQLALGQLDRSRRAVDVDADRFSTTNAGYGAVSPRDEGAFSPRFAELDQKVLKFYAFFQEAVDESAAETNRFRRCTMLYYLEDDSTHILEPQVPNSGIPQGTFLIRHQVPNGATGAPLRWADFRVGTELEIYARVYRVCGCDGFTRRFFQDNGAPQGNDEQMPSVQPQGGTGGGAGGAGGAGAAGSPRGKPTNPLKEYMEASLGRFHHDSEALDQYLTNDGKVLRFQCVWDDRRSLYGEIQDFTVLYYLADSTMQVLENRKKNDGRDPYPSLLTRRKLAKNWAGAGVGGAGGPDPADEDA
jgi:hypothetical protein